MKYDKDYLQSLNDSIIKKALAKGVDEVESYISISEGVNITTKGPFIEVLNSNPTEFEIKVVIGKKIGIASVTSLEEKQIEETIDKAIKVAKIIPEDKNFIKLADPIKRNSKDGILSDEILQLGSSDLVKMVIDATTESKNTDSRIISSTGMANKTYNVFSVANSNGINEASEGAGYYIAVAVNAKADVGTSSGYEFLVSRKKVEDITGLGEKAAKRALEFVSPQKLEGAIKYPIVFENLVFSDLLSVMMEYTLSARHVMYKESYYTDKLEQEVASKKFTLIDDGQLPEGLSTTKIDREGVPRQKTVVIDKGKLVSFLTDSYSAYKLNLPLTGNSSGNAVSPTNLRIEGGNKKLQDLIESFDKCVVIKTNLLGVGHSNSQTGDFSILATNPMLWSGKELKPIKPVTLAGNFYKILHNVIEVGNDYRLFSDGYLPSIAIEGITISS